MKYDAVDWMNVQIQVIVGYFSLVRHEYDAISEAAPLPGKEAVFFFTNGFSREIQFERKKTTRNLVLQAKKKADCVT